MNTRSGLTLLELVCALLIASLLTAAVAVSFAGTRREAEISEVFELIAAQDHLTRTHARMHNRSAHLLFDLDNDTVARLDADQRASQGHTVQLPSTIRIQQVRINSPVTRGELRPSGRRITIHCSPQGYTPMYAIELSDLKGPKRWLLIAGLTGKPVKELNEKQVEAIFAKVSGTRHDTD